MDALCGGLIALVAKALGPALAAPRASIMSPAAAFVTIRRYIDAHLHLPTLDVDGLNAVFGVSRASLYRLFEPTGGVASYIRRARLSRAFQEIAASETSGRQIGPIVYALGFKNVSAFNRLFKETVTGADCRAVRLR
jgi:AraC-like DNA-binding protein